MSDHYYCISVEREGGVAQGAGFLIGFRSPRALDSGHDPDLAEWMGSVVAAVLKFGAGVFAEQGGDAAAARLADELRGLDASQGFQIESAHGVPAVQAESLDGRRLEIDFGSRTRFPGSEVRRNTLEPSASQTVSHGVAAVREHGQRRFRFRAGTPRLITALGSDFSSRALSTAWNPHGKGVER